MSDCDAVVGAIEEAQRILSTYDGAGPRQNQDELLAMLQFLLCSPTIAGAVGRLKSRARLSLVES